MVWTVKEAESIAKYPAAEGICCLGVWTGVLEAGVCSPGGFELLLARLPLKAWGESFPPLLTFAVCWQSL